MNTMEFMFSPRLICIDGTFALKGMPVCLLVLAVSITIIAVFIRTLIRYVDFVCFKS